MHDSRLQPCRSLSTRSQYVQKMTSFLISLPLFRGENKGERLPAGKRLRYVHDSAATRERRFFQRLVMGRPSCVGPLSRTRATQSSDEGAALMLGR